MRASGLFEGLRMFITRYHRASTGLSIHPSQTESKLYFVQNGVKKPLKLSCCTLALSYLFQPTVCLFVLVTSGLWRMKDTFFDM